MKARKLVLPLLLLLVVFSPLTAAAETRYVSDQLIITLRRGMGEEYRILKTLPTGTPLEVLEEHDRYLKVREPDGVTGYVLKQYVSSETPKSQVIARLEKERTRLREQLSKAEEELKGFHDRLAEVKAAGSQETQLLQQEVSRLQSLSEQVRSELAEVRSRYEALQEKSSHVVDLVAERDQLKEENARLTREVQELREENHELLRTGLIQWFLAGAGVFFGGWLIGKLSRRKRTGFI